MHTVVRSLPQLIGDITVDAHGGDERVSGFLQVFHDEVTTQISATVLGMTVEVTGFHLEEEERRGLVAICRHQETTGTVAVADVRVEPVLVAGCPHAAGRTWLCLPPLPVRRSWDWSWPQL